MCVCMCHTESYPNSLTSTSRPFCTGSPLGLMTSPMTSASPSVNSFSFSASNVAFGFSLFSSSTSPSLCPCVMERDKKYNWNLEVLTVTDGEHTKRYRVGRTDRHGQGERHVPIWQSLAERRHAAREKWQMGKCSLGYRRCVFCWSSFMKSQHHCIAIMKVIKKETCNIWVMRPTLMDRERINFQTYIGSFSEAGIQFVSRRGGEDVFHHANSQPSTLRARWHHRAHPDFTATVETLPWPTGHHDWLRHRVIWHGRNGDC